MVYLADENTQVHKFLRNKIGSYSPWPDPLRRKRAKDIGNNAAMRIAVHSVPNRVASLASERLARGFESRGAIYSLAVRAVILFLGRLLVAEEDYKPFCFLNDS